MRPTILSFGLLAAAACGKVQANGDGGNGIDAAPGPDADPHGVVTVTVLNTDQSGTPVQGVPVVFFDPDGTMVGKSDTDAQGQATATVLPGANVSVVWPKSATAYLIGTIYAIKPGDDLVVGFRNPDTADVATFQVTYDAYAGATGYQIYGPCGPADGNGVLHFQAACKTDPFDVYVVASGSSGPLAWNGQNGVSLGTGSVHLASAGWSFVGQFTASYTNVPATVTELDVDHVAGFPGGYDAGASGTPANNALSLAIDGTPTAGTYAWVSSIIVGPMGSQQIVRQRVAGASTSAGMDVSGTILPWLSQAAFDVPTQALSVTSDGSGTYDTYLADLQYQRGTGSSAINYEWIVLGPTIGTITLPTLPADVGNVNPQATDVLGAPLALAIDDDGDGWDSVRDHIFDEFRSALEGTSTSKQLRVTITQVVN